ncbi:VWA domain-containing protein [Legionella dresdenensis]|uniref:VWA domain-containing protein n=1 Tax=Legionella dresdenensis TaxID=450200 RepID=A0ABV8CHK1_9GAMM
MLADFHFLRPWWLLAIIPLLLLAWRMWRQNPRLQSWHAICDSHLLAHLVSDNDAGKRHAALLLLVISALFMVIALAGPAWQKLPVPAFQKVQARVVVLDMSDNMFETDLTPDRLTRAKFKLQDLFSRRDVGQFGMVVFTGEPFVVSPLTDDGQTIISLLSSLTQDIMPVDGQRLDTALVEAAKLIEQAGFKQGRILVLTASTPPADAADEAEKLAMQGIYTSVMPMVADKTLLPLYKPLAEAGSGEVVPYSGTSDDLEQWLNDKTGSGDYARSEQDDIPVWRDEGRWFLLPAIILWLPVFRRGWIQRIDA